MAELAIRDVTIAANRLADKIGAFDQIAESITSIDETLDSLKNAAWEIANVGRLAASLMDGGAINVRQHEGLCIGAPLGLKLTPSQCDEIGKFVASAIQSGALKLTKPLASGKCTACGCTVKEPCFIETTEEGRSKSIDACYWVNIEETLCSGCVEPQPATKEEVGA